jgi:hypothetical protein
MIQQCVINNECVYPHEAALHAATVRDTTEQTCGKIRGKVSPVHTMKEHRGSGGIAPLVLYLGTRWT